MRVVDLCERVRPAYGGDTWAEAVSMLLADDVEAATVNELLNDLVADGRFNEPVVVDWDELVIANGMHRITAALVAQVEMIDVASEGPDGWDLTLIAEFEVTAASSGDGAASRDELFERVATVLRSFPVNGVWVECYASSTGGQMSSDVAGWDGDPQVLADGIRDRCAAWNLTVVNITVRSFTWD